MSVGHVEVLVEEPSTHAALEALLPRILRGPSFTVHPHQGKEDLLKNLPSRLRGYANFLPDDWRILILVDRDEEDCRALKRRLERIAQQAGLTTRSSARNRPYVVINRIACEELEAWYFGDWEAVRAAYPRVPLTIPAKRGFRDPDAIKGGTWESLERVLQRAGYFEAGLSKIALAQDVALHMVPVRNSSRSFMAFVEALESLR